METNKLKQFEKYHNGEMSPEEKDAFEALLARDASMKADFEEYLGIFEALKDRETLDLRIKLKEIMDENAKNKYGSDFFKHGYNWLWMAALLTIFISFTVIISLLISKPEVNPLMADGLENVDIVKFSALDRELQRFEQRNMDFKLESPSAQFLSRKDPLTFKWTVNSKEPLIIELIDWEGNIVFSSGKPVKSPWVTKKKLPSGILVYRFRTSTEAYYIGFLFLR